MDSNFLEFDPFAVADNGSCQTPVVLGCMYNEAPTLIQRPTLTMALVR